MQTLNKTEMTKLFREKLAQNEKWALRGLMRIYSYQTAAEQFSENTVEDNGVGFTGVDANILSSFAKQYEKRGFLTPKQLTILFKKMPKYAGQLMRIVKGDQK